MTTSSLSFGERTTPSAAGTARCPSCSHPQTAFTPWTSWSRAWCTKPDNIIGQAPKDASFILSLVTNTSWGLPPGLVRSLFYGRPIWTVADGTPDHRRYGFQQLGEEPALFQEEQYTGLSGTLIVDQPEGRGPCGQALLNPWARSPLQSSDVACAVFEKEREEEENGFRVMRWA